MDWGPILSSIAGGISGAAAVLLGRVFDERAAQRKRAQAVQSTATKTDTETARDFYNNLLNQYERMQKRCDDLTQEKGTLEARLAREQNARERAEELCDLHNGHLDEVYLGGGQRWPDEWAGFIVGLRSARPPKRSRRYPQEDPR
jgi:hypothetical protein